jgi:hypothetical protein
MKKITSYISNLDKNKFSDLSFLENEFILKLGLNDEVLDEQPEELKDFFGKGFGLKIWQYPNQFAKYIKFLTENANDISSYLEIGARHGGTFIVTSEILKKFNKNFRNSTAIDLIEPNINIQNYLKEREFASYKMINSISPEFISFINKNPFDLVLIDGDHRYDFVKSDGDATRDISKIQVYHDIVNNGPGCIGVGIYWDEIKNKYKSSYNFYEFTDQYHSVIKRKNTTYLGIGVAVKKAY